MLSKIFKPYHVNNENLIRIGPKFDGGYVVDKRIIKLVKTIITCGLNDDWNFEKNFLKLNPNCNVIAYDHTINNNFWIERFKKDAINFLKLKKIMPKQVIDIFKYFDYRFFFRKKNKHFLLKVGKNSINNKEISINSILKNLDHVLIKIDIEGNEYQTLTDIKKNSNKILCLAIEFHNVNENIKIIENFINEIEILKLIHIHGNNFAGTNNNGDPNSLELTFVNNNKLKLDLIKTTKTFPINGIDYPNWKRQKDINLKFDE